MQRHADNSDQVIIDSIKRATVFNWMEDNQVSRLVVHFNGEGDSGSFEDYVEVFPTEKGNYARISQLTEQMKEHELPHIQVGEGRPNTLWNLVLQMSESIESNTPHGKDWWNNEGGQGQVEWILDGEGEDGNTYRRGICLTVEERIVTVEGESFAIEGLVAEDDSL